MFCRNVCRFGVQLIKLNNHQQLIKTFLLLGEWKFILPDVICSDIISSQIMKLIVKKVAHTFGLKTVVSA